MGAKRIGVYCMFFGVAAFVLPFFGLQFRLLNLLGGAQFFIAGALALLGLLLVIFGSK